MEGNFKNLYEFGPFRLDVKERLLLRDGVVVPLTPKAFDLLLALVEQPGHLLEKETLLKAVWPDSFVEENNLADNISKLRKALNDGENGQKFIETIPKRGYRFVAEVRVQKGATAAPDVTPQPAPPILTVVNGEAMPRGQVAVALPISEKPAKNISSRGRGNVYRRRALLICGALIIAAAVPLYLSLRSRWRMPRVARYTRVTTDGRLKRDAVVTDGARVYFSEQQGGQIVLAQVSTAGGETATFQPSLPNANLLAISPDRSKLLVGRFEATTPECPLWVAPVTGGPPYRLGGVLAHAGAWSPDGERITYATGGELFTVKNDGSEPRKLVDVPGRIDWPRWSPDGSRLRFTVRDGQTLSPSLWEVAADGATPHPLLPDWNKPEGECCGNWTTDGKYFVFESSHNRASNIWVLREDAVPLVRVRHEPLQLTFGPMDFHAPVPSADGSRIFVIGEQRRGELIRYDANTRQFASYLSGLSAEGLNFSANGEWITYTTYPEGCLWRSKVDGSQRLQLSFAPMHARMPRWSPDGKRIAFTAQLPGKPWKVYLVSVEGGSLQLLSPEERDERDANWAPDGNSLVFASRIAPGGREIRLLDLRSNQASMPPGGTKMFSPRWSPDGRHISALTIDPQKLMLFDVTTHKWEELIQTHVGFPNWSRNGKYIYFTDQYGNEPGIKRIRIADRKIEWVADLKELRLVENFFGKWFGLAPDDSPLMLRDVGIQDIYALDIQTQ